MGAIPWATIEKAIHAWVVASSGVSAEHVFWTGEGTPKRTLPRIAMTIDDPRRVGLDGVTYDAAPGSPPPESDTRIRVSGTRAAVLRLQAFASEDSGTAARKLLEEVQAAMPLHAYELYQAGVGVLEMEAPHLVSGKASGLLEPRATCDINISVPSLVEGRTGSIAEITVGETRYNDVGDELEPAAVVAPPGDAFDDSFAPGFGG